MKSFIIAAAAAAALPAAAQAADNTVSTTSQSVTIGGVTFGSNNGAITGENTGGGAVAINANRVGTAGGVGDTGSLEIKGDRSRYVIGSLYGTTGSTGFLLSQLGSVTFDWNNATVGSGQRYAAPAARVIVADNSGARTELIWEYIYNGGSVGTDAPTDQWLSVGTSATWYANLRAPGTTANVNQVLDVFKANSQASTSGFNIVNRDTQGRGVLGNNGSQINQTLASWTSYFSADARVVGISFGAGSGFGGNYTGYVDNLAVTTAAGTDRVNFEAAATAAVPEPASWAMMIGGFALVGGAARRRSVKVRFA